MKKTALVAAVMVLLSANLARPDVREDGAGLARFVPPGALAYLEIDDARSRLAAALDNPRAGQFARNRAFQDFTVSKLYTKLRDRIQALEEATGFGLNIGNVRALSGGRTAIALYDIGELRFVFISTMTMEQAAGTVLWNLREKFEQRSDGTRTYYVKEDPYGRAALAFAFVDGKLVAGTDVYIFEQALALLAGEDGDTQARNDSFVSAFPAEGEAGALTLYLDQKRIMETPYWRSYWVFGNQDALADIESAVISVSFGADEFVERRWIRRVASQPEAAGANALAAALPSGAFYYEYGGVDENALTAQLGGMFPDADADVLKELVAAVSQGSPGAYGLAAGIGGEQGDFERAPRKTVSFAFGAPESFDTQALEAAISKAVSVRLLPAGNAGLRFAERDGARVLDLPLFEDSAPAYRLDGSTLTLASSIDYLPGTDAANTVQQTFVDEAGEFSGASWLRLDAARAAVTDLFKVLSGKASWRPQSNAGFFSANVPSLLEALDFISDIMLVRKTNGSMVAETVRYRLAP